MGKGHPLVGQPVEVHRLYLLSLLSLVCADAKVSIGGGSSHPSWPA